MTANSKAKRRALALLEQANGVLLEALRELEQVPEENVDMRLDDAHAFVRRAKRAVEQAQVSINDSLS